MVGENSMIHFAPLTLDRDAIIAKKRRVEKFMDYAKTTGALAPNAEEALRKEQ